MAAPTIIERFSWERGPFKLITTPQYLKHPDDTFTAGATHMALVHNTIIRALNAIYIQCPHVPRAKVGSFLKYCGIWHKLVNIHHDGEEAEMFPAMEKEAGAVGIMARNVEQHHAFEKGMQEFGDYVQSCEKGGNYDGMELRLIIDTFGDAFVEHLSDEVTMLEQLRTEHPNVDVARQVDEQGARGTKHLNLAEDAVFFFIHHDITHEGGLHSAFPAAPWILKFLLKYVLYGLHKDIWEFAPCTRYMKPRELLYLS